MSWTLSRYLARRFVGTLGWALLVIMAIIVLGNLLELSRENGAAEAGLLRLSQIAVLKAPSVALVAAPFVVMLAALASFGQLARSSELVVTRAAGLSVWSVIAPAVASAALLGVLAFAALNPLAAASAQRAETLEARHLEGGEGRLSVSSGGVWLRQAGAQGQTVVHARRADAGLRVLESVTVFDFDRVGAPIRRIDAASARLTPGAWVLTDAVERDLTTAGRGDALAAPERMAAEMRAPTDLTLEQILESFEPPETIPFWRLPSFIATLEQAGFSAVRHRLHWQSQLATPLLFAGMAMIGAAFAMRPARLGGLGGMALGAVAAGFGFYFLFDIAKALGASGAAPVAAAAWAPPLAAVLFASGLLLHLEDG
jgi:lipopolysaccharide export system permease protein